LLQLYPDRVAALAQPAATRAQDTFVPMLLPTPRQSALPGKVIAVSRKTATGLSRQIRSAAGAASVLDTEATLAIGKVVDGSRFYLRCTSQTLGNYGIRFQEYDRTQAELGGGPYTGTGSRENLGTTVTDPFGNYVFRFTRTV